ncbi:MULTISPECIES: hypothetical protein [unclassified Sphingobium]|uniref:hypothetical protein n=1 Tax=unclassified Sphingobium TaxID=2611147 RepID=UPI0035A5E750
MTAGFLLLDGNEESVALPSSALSLRQNHESTCRNQMDQNETSKFIVVNAYGRVIDFQFP